MSPKKKYDEAAFLHDLSSVQEWMEADRMANGPGPSGGYDGRVKRLRQMVEYAEKRLRPEAQR